MTPQEFAQKIKAKYPQYQNVDDIELTNKILAKYPIYRSQISNQQQGAQDSTLGQKVLNAGTAVTNFLGGKAIADTFGAEIAKVGKSDQEKEFIAQEQPTVKETIGSGIQFGANFIPGAGVGGGLARKAAIGAATGQLIDTGADLQQGDSIGESLKPGVDAAVGAGLPVVGRAFSKFGSLLGKAGDKIQFSVVKPSQADIKDGFKIATVKKYDLGGSLKQSFEKTENKLSELSQQLDAKLTESTSKVDLNKVYENTAKKLGGNKLESFGSNTQLGNATEKLREEILAVAGDGQLDVKAANQVKRAAGHFGAWQFGVADPEAKARERVYNAFYNELKQEIEKQSPDGVKEINKQMSEIIPVMNALIRRIPVAERNNLVSLGDVITLTGASFNPSAGLLTLANLASKSGRVGNALSKAGDNIAERTGEISGPVRDLLTKIFGQTTD